MDELEFRKRVYADPDNLDQDTLDAAAANPDLQRILDQTLALNGQLMELAAASIPPSGLKARLLAIPEQAGIDTSQASAEANPKASDELAARRARASAQSNAAGNASHADKPGGQRRYYAIAACLLLAVGLSIALPVNRGPSAEEMAFGNDVIAHIYHESEQLNAIAAGGLGTSVAMPTISNVMANSGSRLSNASFLQNMPVRYAQPCDIAQPFQSSHLILDGDQGAINVITINNSPVSQEFSIGDDRFSGVVIPMRGGNLILITEKNQDPSAYRGMIEDNVDWVI
ncbi:MAG: DUF3379 family protein [Pseudohongiellaceae bacterium]|jgi:hypothetical protein